MDLSGKASKPVVVDGYADGRTPGGKHVPRQAGILPTTIKAKNPSESIYSQQVNVNNDDPRNENVANKTDTCIVNTANGITVTEDELRTVEDVYVTSSPYLDDNIAMNQKVNSNPSELHRTASFSSSDADDEKEDHNAVSEYEWTEDERIDLAPAGCKTTPESSSTSSNDGEMNYAAGNLDASGRNETTSSEDSSKEFKVVATRVGRKRIIESNSSEEEETNEENHEMEVVPKRDNIPKSEFVSVDPVIPKEVLTKNPDDEQKYVIIVDKPIIADNWESTRERPSSAEQELCDERKDRHIDRNSNDTNSEAENCAPEVSILNSISQTRSTALTHSLADAAREILGTTLSENSHTNDKLLRTEAKDFDLVVANDKSSGSRALTLSTRKFVFIGDEKAIPKQLNQLQEQSLRQRHEFQNQIHNLERKIAAITAQLADESIETDVQLKSVQENSIYKPLEQSYQRSALHQSRSCIGSTRWINVEKRMAVFNSQMTHSVFVGFPDAKRQAIDKLRDEIEQNAKIEFKLDTVQAEKREGALVYKYEEMVGSMERRYQEERAARLASLQVVTEDISSCHNLDVTRYEQILENIRILREQINAEKMARKERDEEILRMIAENQVILENAILDAFGDNKI